jgi:hypothetical protein
MRNALRPHSLQDFEAVHSGQTDVEDHEVERGPLRFPERGFAIVDYNRIVARFGKRRGNMPGEPDFIIYYQNAHAVIRREQVLPPSTNCGDGRAALAAS